MDPPPLSFRLFICKVRGLGVLPRAFPALPHRDPPRPWQTGAGNGPFSHARRQHARHRRDSYWAMYQEVPSEQETLASRMDLSNQKLFVITPCLAFLDYEWGICKPQQHLL